MKGLWRDLARERRFVIGWQHLALTAVALIIACPGVALSMGLSDRGLLVIGRATIPLLAALYVPGLVLKEVTGGTLEFIATSPRGLSRVWLARLILWLSWAAATALVFLLVAESRASVRHGVVVELASGLIDLVVFAAWGAAWAHRLGSEAAGVLGGLVLWFLGVLLGIGLAGPTWLGGLTPLSVYFFGPVPRLVINRAGWSAVAAVLLWWQWRTLQRPQTLLTARE